MASREKRPLAPSKSKQKVNNDCTLPTVDQKNRKGKSQTNTRQQQIAQDILESVATGSQLPVKINASLPRKKAIKNLRRKPKLKPTKSNLIKVKITKKAPIRSLRKTNVETVRGVKGRRTKKNTEEKNIETDIQNPDNDISKTGLKSTSNSAKSVNTALHILKNSLKPKKIKYPIRSTEADNCITEIPGQETETTNSTVINSRNSPKAGRKVKITYKKLQSLDTEDPEDNTSLEAETKNNKACKVGAVKKSTKDTVKAVEDNPGSSKNLRFKRNTSKDRDVQNNTRGANAIDTKNIKAIPDNKNLVDLTIDEVIASTVVGSVIHEAQGSAKKPKKGRKVSERTDRLLSESEIKRESDTDEVKICFMDSERESDSEVFKGNQIAKDRSQNSSDSLRSILPRTRYNRTLTQRSLRNGKLRRSSELGISLDLESNKQYKFEPEDQTGSDTCVSDLAMDVIDGEPVFYESNSDNSRGNMNSTKGEVATCTNEKASLKNFDDDENSEIEVRNNNNGERGENSEVGPMLRSKTKSKTMDSNAASLEIKASIDSKPDEIKSLAKNSSILDESKKSTIMEHTRKENILVNISDKPKSRRSSLNVEIKKTVGSFYGSDKSDSPKSQIDQMIENIKLNIAKSIESKIFGPENSLVLNKNFERSKPEEIIAPLSTELQKKSLDEKDEDVNTPNVSKSEMKSENSENSVPKVADTAKEIEKMVMGDMEIADTQYQKGHNNDNSNLATASNIIKVFESKDINDSENMHVELSTSVNEELLSGTCSSHLETRKRDEHISKIVNMPQEGTIDNQQRPNETQHTSLNIATKITNTRESRKSNEKSSITIPKLLECNKSQFVPKILEETETGRTSSIVLDKTPNINEKTLLKNSFTDSNESAVSNTDEPQCSVNYEIFNEDLKDCPNTSITTVTPAFTEAESVALPSTVNDVVKAPNNVENSLEISDNVNSLLRDHDDGTYNEVILNATIQSEESETLESISREVERLVAESETVSTKVTKSAKRVSGEILENIENQIENGENTKSSLLSSNKTTGYDDFKDIVDAEADTNRFLDALESSITESDILNIAPEITKVLTTKELAQIDSIHSKATMDLEKLTPKPDEAADCENDQIPLKLQEVAHNSESTLHDQDIACSTNNFPITSAILDENTVKASELQSQGVSRFLNVKEATELQHLNIEPKGNCKELVVSTLTGQKSVCKDLQIFEESNKSIENNRSSTNLDESFPEKLTNSQENSPHVSNEVFGITSENVIKSQITAEEQTTLNEENKRVLRARDRQKKVESGRKSQETVNNAETCDKIKPSSNISEDGKNIEDADNAETVNHPDFPINDNSHDLELSKQNNPDHFPDNNELQKAVSDKQEAAARATATGPLIRTRRSREVKKRKDDQPQIQNVQKSKRSKRDNKKSDQQNKEETLLDNEVAKINENTQSLTEKYNKSYKTAGNFRGFSEGGSKNIFGSGKVRNNDKDRSHSETDLEMVKLEMENVELSEKRLDNISALPDIIENRSRNSDTASDNEKKVTEHTLKISEALQKDLDETSTSSESSRSAAVTPKILETPEDKVKKESILRLLGLESLEKAAERMNHQKAKKEQYTGTLKTVIRVQKEKDKKRSRSPLKMVLKQGRSDGDGDSPEFYTIQKELGTSGLGDSSSGANRKFSTNHRHSCDEDPEEPPSKDRQSLVIPEKSSSFSIHPGRLCADVCCYCFGKFGSLDTPMHLAQMKSDERRKKILNIERHLTKDSCLCDACYRHVDRKANTSPTNMQTKPQRQHRQLMVSKCSARDCREPARHHVKRRWLLKIKAGLQNQVDIDWESSQHTSMSVCANHYSKIERFLTCALCKRRLARNHTHQLIAVETDELNERLRQQGIPVPLSAGTFVCKLCRYFTQLQLKYKDIENMNANHKSFFKSYRKRILHYHDIEVLENEEEDSSSQGQPAKDKEKRKKSKCGQGKSGSSKSLDSTHNSASEKSTPEPNKNDGLNFEPDNDNFSNRNSTNEKNCNMEGSACQDIQILNVADSIDNLKKRKSQDMQGYNSNSTLSCGSTNDLVEILAMDKEVTLTRLPKRARTNSDITPVVQRLGANPSISVRTLFPGEEEMNLHANVEFNNVREVTPQGWEKCATMIQYDRDTKLLWQELQRPYGNQSSFLRHLILLEKYYRSGDLVLAPNASRNAINYSTSVQNRLISYEGPEKVDEPILEPISTEFASPRRLSGGFMMERDRLSMPSTSSFSTNVSMNSSMSNPMASLAKASPPRILKLNSGVSIIKKPPPNLHRLNLPSPSTSNANNSKRKEHRLPVMSGGKVFQLSEPEFRKLQNLKRQKQMLNDKQMPNQNVSTNSSGSTSPSALQSRPATTQYQKAQMAAQTQFQKHLLMQQEMLSRQSRSDFEPLICDVRSLTNENNPTQNLLNNLNLPKSIQVTTKPPNTIPIMPKIPKSLTVIPQTITRPTDK